VRRPPWLELAVPPQRCCYGSSEALHPAPLSPYFVTRSRETIVDFIRASLERRYALVINDATPVANTDDVWTSAGQIATIGIFIILAIGFLYLTKAFMLPLVAALIIGTTLAPLVKYADRRGMSSWMAALLLVLVLIGIFSLAVTLLAGPIGEWIARAPDIGASVKNKFYVLDRPLAAFRELQHSLMPQGDAVEVTTNQNVVLPVVSFVTPAVSEFVLFFGTLTFYLISHIRMRSTLISMLSTREAKLRALRISKDIEHNLAGYITVFTIINTSLGIIVAVGAWLFGFPNPVIIGLLAMILNYVPYIGPAVMAGVLFLVGLASFPTLGYSLLPPLAFVALTTAEGQFITPLIMGRRLTLNPLMIFLALGFWTFLWGPFGAFLAVPLSIIAMVMFNHLFAAEDVKLPD
jgi:predicted PurR-regulated permease PerM